MKAFSCDAAFVEERRGRIVVAACRARTLGVLDFAVGFPRTGDFHRWAGCRLPDGRPSNAGLPVDHRGSGALPAVFA